MNSSIISIMHKCFGSDDSLILDQNHLDSFFIIISDIFFKYINNGLEGLNFENTDLKNYYSKKIFIYGFTCITEGVDPVALEIILSYLTKHEIKNNINMTPQETFEILFIEKTLILIQTRNIKDYMFVLNQFCSSQVYSVIYQKFKSYI